MRQERTSEAARSIESDMRPRKHPGGHPADDRPAEGDCGRLRAGHTLPPHGFEAVRVG